MKLKDLFLLILEACTLLITGVIQGIAWAVLEIIPNFCFFCSILFFILLILFLI